MNPDYAHLLPHGLADQKLLGRLLTNEMRRQNLSFRKVAKVVGVDHHTVRTLAGGGNCSFSTGLKICIFLDLNPFEIFRDVSRENTSSPLSAHAAVEAS
ncbi:MAG: hypothetical protein AAFY12_12305 [Pseudomonadota bacterium]